MKKRWEKKKKETRVSKGEKKEWGSSKKKKKREKFVLKFRIAIKEWDLLFQRIFE